MFKMKTLFLVIIFGLFIFSGVINCKRIKKLKLQKEDPDNTTPRPDVVTYSSFGYNDVGGSAYEGFVPSSPDYASFLSSFNQETTTRLYAPAFPTALDNMGSQSFNNYESPAQEGEMYNSLDGQSGTANMQFQDNSFINEPSFSETSNIHYSHDDEDGSVPVYGTKLSSKNRNLIFNQYNASKNIYETEPSNSYTDNIASYQGVSNIIATEPSGGALNTDDKKIQNIYEYAPTYPPTNYNSEYETKPNNNELTYAKVVDFTKYKIPYPTELEQKYTPEITKSLEVYTHNKNPHSSDNMYPSSFRPQYDQGTEKSKSKYKDSSSFTIKKPFNFQESTYNQIDLSHPKYESMNEFKDKVKDKVIKATNNNDIEYPSFKYSFRDSNTHYNIDNFTEFQTNDDDLTNANNQFDIIDSASTNMIDLTNYKFPKGTYSYFKDHNFQQSYGNPNEWNNVEASNNNLHNPHKPKKSNIQSNVPATTSYWGNSYRPYSTPPTFKNNYRKPQGFDEDIDNVVHIPKKNQNNKYFKYHEPSTSKLYTDWKMNIKSNSFKFGIGKPIDEWNKEVSTRFKSEEDLLGLRNQDTSHPSYLPTFKFNNEADEYPKYASNFDYKTTIEKWRQSYLKSKNKYKRWKDHDTEGMGSDSEPIHVPIPKPYPVSTKSLAFITTIVKRSRLFYA